MSPQVPSSRIRMRWRRYTQDLYEILQVSPLAEAEVVTAAYRRLCQKYHPDRNSDPSAAARMRDLNAAYEVLGDPERRAEYDLSRNARSQRRPPRPNVGADDLSPSLGIEALEARAARSPFSFLHWLAAAAVLLCASALALSLLTVRSQAESVAASHSATAVQSTAQAAARAVIPTQNTLARHCSSTNQVEITSQTYEQTVSGTVKNTCNYALEFQLEFRGFSNNGTILRRHYHPCDAYYCWMRLAAGAEDVFTTRPYWPSGTTSFQVFPKYKEQR
jgi:hypothetical protein